MRDPDSSIALRSDLPSAIQPWIVVLSAALFFFYEFFQMHMFNPISGYLMQELHIDALHLGYLSSTYLIGDVLGLIPAGLLLDRFSARRVIIFALITCIIGTLAFATAHTFWLAALGHFLAGVGNAFCFISCLVLTSRWFESRHQAFVIGIIVTIAMLGGVCAQTPLSLVVETFGWRQAVMIDVIMGLIILTVIYNTVKDHPENYQTPKQHTTQMNLLGSLSLALQNPQNWLCGLYTSFLSLPIMLLGAVWGDLYLSQVHHFTLIEATQVTSMLFFGTIVGSPVMGAWSDSLGLRRLPMLLGGIASLITVILIISASHLSIILAATGFFLLGFFTSAQVISYPAIAESNSQENAATALSVASVIIMGGPAIFQPLFGLFMQWHWNHTVFDNIAIYSQANYFQAMLLFPLAFVIAITAIFTAKETYCQAINKENVCLDP